jgi:hypothetical protein
MNSQAAPKKMSISRIGTVMAYENIEKDRSTSPLMSNTASNSKEHLQYHIPAECLVGKIESVSSQ